MFDSKTYIMKHPVILQTKQNDWSFTSLLPRRHVLRRSEGMENLGLPQLHLMAPLVLAWFITILGIIKGVKSLGKVNYLD